MESRPDFDQAKNDKGAQEALRDFEAAQENYFMAAGSIPNRILEYCNLDVMRVKQDIETRPLIFQHCFRHSASQQDAMECIYAFPPDLYEHELRDLERVAVDGPDTSARMADGGTRDNCAPSSGLEPDGFLLDYEEYLESVYRFQIEWADGSYDTNRLTQLENLARSTVHIIGYLDEVYKDDPNTSGIEAFRKHFSQNEYGKQVVFLGADDDNGAGGAGYGRVPLQPGFDEEGSLINCQELRMMYLGSKVNIPTIVHEFGHVIDRGSDIISKVYAMRSGVVIDWVNLPKGFGNTVTVEHDGTCLRYTRLDKKLVKKGERVGRGQQIGTVGKGAKHIYAAHLHLDMPRSRVYARARTYYGSPADPAAASRTPIRIRIVQVGFYVQRAQTLPRLPRSIQAPQPPSQIATVFRCRALQTDRSFRIAHHALASHRASSIRSPNFNI